MAKGISFTQVGKLLSKVSAKATPASLVAEQGIGTAKAISKEVFGYDFVGLLLKIFIYFVVAFVFAKFMEAVIFTRGIWITLANLLGFNIPKADQIPETLKKLFDSGLAGFKYWDIIKIVAILLVITEAMRYVSSQREGGGKSSPMTLGVFTLIIAVLGITTIPELISRIKTTDFNLETLK